MSLDKAIQHGKEHRKPYRGSKAIDATCRNHGGCPWCEENRKYKFRDKHPIEPEDYIVEENCNECRYAIWDYEEYLGGGRQYFIDGCRLGYSSKEECDEENREEE